jgi:uncharacterized protein (TIGR00297 family)
VTSSLRRAGAYAAVGTLALGAPVLGAAAAAPFAAVAFVAAFLVTEGPLFELFARPGDHEDRRLNGLAGFALAATGLALLTTLPDPALPTAAFVGAVLVVSYGNLGKSLVAETSDDPFQGTVGFLVGGFLAALGGMVAAAATLGTLSPVADAVGRFLVLAAVAALVAALVRETLFERDDPLVMLLVGLVLGPLVPLLAAAGVTLPGAAVAIVVSGALGYASFLLGTASVTGMLTGVVLLLVTAVLGGLGWLVVLVTFFGLGGLSTKFRYDEKLDRGVAEPNEGARGTRNVLGNAAVALVAVVGFAAAPLVPFDALGLGVGGADVATLFRFAFAGSVAAAMADTLSSEVGGLFDSPRLVTTLRTVPPGTDGAVTWQGEVAGAAGATLVGALAAALLLAPSVPAVAVVAAGGVAGMTADSLLGATVEGNGLGNEAVNFSATLVGAVATAALAAAVVV